jgi:hypothetical protein
MAKAKSIEKLSDDELMKRWSTTAKALLELRKENRELSEEFHRREQQKAIEQKLAGLNDEERKVLGLPAAQVLAPAGVESGEEVHNG